MAKKSGKDSSPWSNNKTMIYGIVVVIVLAGFVFAWQGGYLGSIGEPAGQAFSQITTLKCYDTDPTDSPAIRGDIIMYNKNVNITSVKDYSKIGSYTKFSDFCYAGNTSIVNQVKCSYFPKASKYASNYTISNCPTGTSCKNGICASKTPVNVTKPSQCASVNGKTICISVNNIGITFNTTAIIMADFTIDGQSYIGKTPGTFITTPSGIYGMNTKI